MKYNIGDKVRIKNEIGYEGTCITNIEELKKKVLTVTCVSRSKEDGSYSIGICEDNGWSFNSEWLEVVEDKESAKFEAFLREVANQKSPSYGQEWNWLNEIIHCHRNSSSETFIDDTVTRLVEFYRTFEPKPKQKKKFTMDELREIVGEDFEIVD